MVNKIGAAAFFLATFVCQFGVPANAAPFTLDCAGQTYHVLVTIDYDSNSIVSFSYLRQDGSVHPLNGYPAPAQVTPTAISWIMHWSNPDNDVTETINRTTGTLFDVNPYPYSVTPLPCQPYAGAPAPKF